jgi:hypothetical protein
MTILKHKGSINLIIFHWAEEAKDLLYRATGVKWERESTIEMWDAKITFRHEDYQYTTNYYDFTRSVEDNFFLFLSDILMCASQWRRKNDKNGL